MSEDINEEILTKALNQLIEHYDTVQIFATASANDKEGGALGFALGKGSWFARYGQIRSWVVSQENEMGSRLEKPE